MAALSAQIAAHVALWMKHGSDRIVGGDICNEVNFGRPTTWPSGTTTYNAQMQSDLSAYLAAVRQASPGIPWSFSVYISSLSDLVGPLMQLQSIIGCDFHDFHDYRGYNGSSSVTAANAPASSDVAALEQQSWFIGRHFGGECGIMNSNTDAATSAWIAGQAAIAQRPLSHGGVYFGDQDYVSRSEPGNYGLTGHLAMVTAFQAWPGRQI